MKVTEPEHVETGMMFIDGQPLFYASKCYIPGTAKYRDSKGLARPLSGFFDVSLHKGLIEGLAFQTTCPEYPGRIVSYKSNNIVAVQFEDYSNIKKFSGNPVYSNVDLYLIDNKRNTIPYLEEGDFGDFVTAISHWQPFQSCCEIVGDQEPAGIRGDVFVDLIKSSPTTFDIFYTRFIDCRNGNYRKEFSETHGYPPALNLKIPMTPNSIDQTGEGVNYYGANLCVARMEILEGNGRNISIKRWYDGEFRDTQYDTGLLPRNSCYGRISKIGKKYYYFSQAPYFNGIDVYVCAQYPDSWEFYINLPMGKTVHPMYSGGDLYYVKQIGVPGQNALFRCSIIENEIEEEK